MAKKPVPGALKVLGSNWSTAQWNTFEEIAIKAQKAKRNNAKFEEWKAGFSKVKAEAQDPEFCKAWTLQFVPIEKKKVETKKKMGYDWEGKEQLFRDMYIRDGKTLEEVMAYFHNCHNFSPSKRAWQAQINKWGLPSKHVISQPDAILEARIQELWARNESQKSMLTILQNEGWPKLSERELSRIRERNGWKLRIANTTKGPTKKQVVPAKRSHNQQAEEVSAYEQLLEAQEQAPPDEESGNTPASNTGASTNQTQLTELSDEVMRKREERLAKLRAESNERLENRTRRRRTKGYAGLPPDPPGPPRFPSETTLEEAKATLQLDKAMYAGVRAKFEEICTRNGVIKKTEAGQEKWQSVKDQLIREFLPIQPRFQVLDPQQLNENFLALEMICNDVCKKMRTMKTKVTIAEAKNTLGLDPDQGRQIKAAFSQILKANHFTSKMEIGDERWNELKREWIASSPLLQSLTTDTDPKHAEKQKALEHLCRDVMKRLRDSQTKQEKGLKDRGADNQSSTIPQNPATSTGLSENGHLSTTSSNNTFEGISTLASQALASAPLPMSPTFPAERQQHSFQHTTYGVEPQHDYAGQIDPTLLSAAANNHIYHPHHHGSQPEQQQSASHFVPKPVYFRLSPQSVIQTAPTVWLDTLTAPTLAALKHAAVSCRGFALPRVGRIEGVVQGGDAAGESKVLIEDDEEVGAYLRVVGNGKATFVVGLEYA